MATTMMDQMNHMNQMNQMNQFYQPTSPLMPIRRATEPVTLAPNAGMIDPGLENHRLQGVQLSAGGYGNSARMQMQGQQMQNHLQQQAHHQAQHLQRNQLQQTQLQNPIAMSSQSNPTLQNNRNSGSRTPGLQRTPSGPPERALPGKQVDDTNIDEAYVQFIMYCNPSIAIDVDTAELRRGFCAPPKSDGKSFRPFHLYQLISRLENKDIKTWTELVMELGVSPPDTTKNQSSQKVQQYAVRLKRWLHAFHVDAFFKYLQNLPTVYLSERPLSNSNRVERDGILPEDDLALRALLPEWRPKRGRRKADDIEGEDESNINNKRHNRSSSTDFNSLFDDHYSAVPWSAQPQSADPWAAARLALAPPAGNVNQPPASSQINGTSSPSVRYQTNNNHDAPSSPYPQSAITPRQTFSASPSLNEPKSAHPSTEMEVLSRLRREVEEQLEILVSNKVEISYEKERINKLRIETENESQEITRLQHELEAERKALSMARAWAEDEAKRAREQAKALEVVRERWERHGIKVVVDSDLQEESTVGVSQLNAGKQLFVEGTISRAQTLVDKLKSMATNVGEKSKEFINKIIEKILYLISVLKEWACRAGTKAELKDKCISKARESVQGWKQTTAAFGSVVKRVAGDCREGAEKLTQKFKT